MNKETRNIFVIGNGFDLDLGMKTKYSDFAQSSYWPISDSPVNQGPLYSYLYEYKKNLKDIEKINWFDLEEAFLDFATAQKRYTYEEKDVEQDQQCFLNLECKFSEYLNDAQSKLEYSVVDKISVNVLNAIRGNGYFKYIYSFNYTDFSALAKYYINYLPENVVNIHGSLADDSIILGINDKVKVPKPYRFLFKSRSKFYNSNNLVENLLNADECVFFGMSFGSIDSIYFKHFFNEVINNAKDDKTAKKKNITIFTYNEESRASIMDNLYDMNISMSDLYASANFSFVTTQKIEAQSNKDNFDVFIKRLHYNSRNEINRRYRDMLGEI
ncbi:AbiH family protein [Prevotella sp.]|uniref:AbiH family protein n=1 Tax=Prevotella sp. TaxID=59823 RepID=UPI003DA336E5